MEFSLKNIVLGLLLLVAVLVLANTFFIMPFLSFKPEQIASIKKKVVESVELKPVVLRVDSLSIIKRNGIGEGVSHIDSDGQTLRNPFFWPEEKKQQVEVKEIAAHKPVPQKPAAHKPEPQKPEVDEPEPPKPQLSMVLISAGRKQALLDDVFIKEGDMFHGYLVKSIHDNEVVLSGNFGDLSIILGSGEEAEQQAQPPAGLIER